MTEHRAVYISPEHSAPPDARVAHTNSAMSALLVAAASMALAFDEALKQKDLDRQDVLVTVIASVRRAISELRRLS